MIRQFNIKDERLDYYKGWIYEVSLQSDSARKYYISADNYYSKLLLEYPDSTEILMNKALVIDKLFGEQKTNSLFDSYISKHPDNESAIMYKEAFEDYKKTEDSLIMNIR